MKTLKSYAILMAGWMTCTQVTAEEFPTVKPPDKDGNPVAAPQPLANKLFYLPTYDEPDNPGKWGYKFKSKEIISKDGTKLDAWWIEAKPGPAKATVVYSHGTAGSMGHHLGFIMWLAKAGYDVLIYDYRGYGKSQGKTNRPGMVEDARAALEFAGNLPEAAKRPVISYGFSLGGAKSLAAIAGGKTPNLKMAITESTFASYREMALIMGGRLASRMVTDDLSPVDQVAKVSPTPLLVIHGTDDPVVPFAQSQKLFEAAAKPKTFFKVEGGGHGDCLFLDWADYRKKTQEWIEEKLDG